MSVTIGGEFFWKGGNSFKVKEGGDSGEVLVCGGAMGRGKEAGMT